MEEDTQDTENEERTVSKAIYHIQSRNIGSSFMPNGRWVHATNKAYSTCRMELIIRLSTIWSETRAHDGFHPTIFLSSSFSFCLTHFPRVFWATRKLNSTK